MTTTKTKTRTSNTWIDDMSSDIVAAHSEKPGYFDENEAWPEFDPRRLSGSAVFCEYVANTSGNAQPKIRFMPEIFDKGMWFNEPADVHPKDVGRHVKAVKADGTYTQIPMVGYINSETGSKTAPIYWGRGQGFTVYYDESTKTSKFCMAANCYAKAMTQAMTKKYPEHKRAVGTGYCSVRHAMYAEPSKFKSLASQLGVEISPEDQADLDSLGSVTVI